MKKFLTALLVLALACTMVLSVSAKEISFTVTTDDELPYIYEESGNSQEGNGRFHDAWGYIIYEFTIDPGDTYAQLSWSIGNQYEVSISKTANDDDWEVIDTQVRKDDETNNDWGCNGREDKVHDLSKWTQDNEAGKIYVRMGDCDPDGGGWGGYIFKANPVVFYSGTAAPAAEAPEETPAETPAETTPVVDTPITQAPQTSDIVAATLVLAALAAAGVALASKKSK